MEKERCTWCKGFDIYRDYHDIEWGNPVLEDQKLFEFLILEGAQAGLSWITILKKREAFRQAFAGFDYQKVAKFTEKEVENLMQDTGIIRNRLKIHAAINNAQRFMEVQEEFGTFSEYIWKFVHHRPIQNSWKSLSEVPANTLLSDTISKDLKKRGFKFVGTTIIYSFMQAVGMVNDHIISCYRYKELKQG
ncbi:MAG: DNA-3-methyladenine glycosylase I [Chitinophagales bacterium]|nr:DNA-3-methyladenine glycosylase I [Chitinophagales bacterium]